MYAVYSLCWNRLVKTPRLWQRACAVACALQYQMELSIHGCRHFWLVVAPRSRRSKYACQRCLWQSKCGLRSGDFMIGFAHTADVGDGIAAEAIWRDPLVIAVPARHSLLTYKEVPLQELQGHPLVLCDPQVCEGYCRELKRLLNTLEHKLNVVEEVSSLDMMLTLVGAGYGIGFMTATKIPISQRPDVVIRPWRWILP